MWGGGRVESKCLSAFKKNDGFLFLVDESSKRAFPDRGLNSHGCVENLGVFEGGFVSRGDSDLGEVWPVHRPGVEVDDQIALRHELGGNHLGKPGAE